ncbi:probable serpin E3 [Takifugu rubripes]|uniref:Serpin peptidase inhibitor, clade E (nexin, plasminogen activator inhibitor type 1), member 3 n=1 Tax=Takifugu rubripes TaxID=31033 RepID=H2UBC7_TAKRU|nr:serpin E3 [Takifugu rubripes]XP_011611419.1 serpin E3 [Takifugu rubripes]|eukprot:XP_003962254.1 PREDICTED: serpin E3 [Takifugu rubripes]
MCRLPAASLIICFWLAERSQGNSSFQSSMAELHARFAVGLYQTLAETENGSDLIVSPLSVSVSLGLLQLGAGGNTLAQLEGTLGYNVKDVQVQNFLLHPPRDGGQGKWLQQTCTLFLQNGVQLLMEFARQATAWANASVIRANFSQPKPSLEQTGSSRDELWHLQAGGSSGELSGSGEAQVEAPGWSHRQQMALVNTVAFRGVWQKQFQFANTQNLPFTRSDGSSIKVPMMYQATEVSFGQFRTSADQRYTVLELPFLGRTLSLQVVLPSERKTPLSSLESQLTARQVASWDFGLRRTKMDIFLPRFKIQNKFNLRSVLPAIGITDAFNPTTADFSGISAEERLYVSDAFHEVRIEVTEDGTKAAAATSMVLLKRSRAPVFKADRPFLFLLRQTSTGSILFMGRVTNPGDQGA